MKITLKDIDKFVCDFYDIETFKENTRTQSTERSFFYYLAYNYSTDIVSTINLAKYCNIRQHGTVLNGLNNVYDYISGYDPRRKKELNALVLAFEEKFDLEIKEARLYNLTESNLRRKYKNQKERIKQYSYTIHNQNDKIKRLEEKVNKLKKINTQKIIEQL